MNFVPKVADASAAGIELCGIVVLVAGMVYALVVFGKEAFRSKDKRHYRALRENLGRAILLGLEFLVGADIIRTVAVHPTYESVGVLAIIVAIRSFLSFALQKEIEGQPPLRKSEEAGKEQAVRPS